MNLISMIVKLNLTMMILVEMTWVNYYLVILLTNHELSSEDDEYTPFGLLSFDTLNKVYVAWFDDKYDIVQVQIVKQEWNMN